MLQKIILACVVFIVILVALTFGETLFHQVFAWISYLTGLVIQNFTDLYTVIAAYIHVHPLKVVVALVLTIPVSLWIIRNKGTEFNRKVSPRKIAIVLAVFLGWLGGHRFYLGQVGWGIAYLVLFYVFAPLVVILSLVDAIRYAFMSDEEFSHGRV